jgi:hypothetical protein
MKKTLLSCSLLLAFAAAAIAADRYGAKTVPRDVFGVLNGRFTFAGPYEGPWTTTGDVTGTLRHLGLAKMHTTHTTSPYGEISGGRFEIVAANGDRIQGHYTATGRYISDTQVLGTAILTIETGSGRFDRARGTIAAAFLETLDDPTWASAGVSWTLEGTVHY